MTHYLFIETLTFPAFFFHVFPYILRHWNSRQGIIIKYVDAGPVAVFLTCRVGRWTNVTVEHWVFRSIEIRDEHQQWVLLRVMYQELLAVQQDIVKDRLFRDVFCHRERQDRVREFMIKQVVSADMVDPQTMWRALMLIQVARLEKGYVPGTKRVLFLRRRIWSDHIRRNASDYGLRVIFAGGNTRSIKALIRRWFPSRTEILRSIYQCIVEKDWLRLFRGSVAYISSKTSSFTQERKNRGPLVVEYYGQWNLSRPEYTQ